MIPRIIGRSYAIEAELNVPEGGAEGVIVANADFIGGFSCGSTTRACCTTPTRSWASRPTSRSPTEPLPTGDVTVKMLFEADEPKPGTGGKVTLWANGKQIGEGTMPDTTVPIAFTTYAGMDIGRDNGLVVDLAYEDKAPYAFTGTVKNVVFDLKPAHPRGRDGPARAPIEGGRRGSGRRLTVRPPPPGTGRRRTHRTLTRLRQGRGTPWLT